MSVGDVSRNYLVTVLVCTGCGKPLQMTKDKAQSAQCLKDGITEVNKLESHIGVHPCKNCVTTARRPLKLLREAMAELEKQEKEEADNE